MAAKIESYFITPNFLMLFLHKIDKLSSLLELFLLSSSQKPVLKRPPNRIRCFLSNTVFSPSYKPFLMQKAWDSIRELAEEVLTAKHNIEIKEIEMLPQSGSDRTYFRI